MQVRVVTEAALAVAILLVLTVLATGSAQAQTFTTLLSFDYTDGYNPWGGLVQAADGNFYGTTRYGGANSCIISGTDYGCGTVFKITPTGTLTTLYSFCSQSGCTDGALADSRLIQASDGNFYGTTTAGGVSSQCSTNLGPGCGTIFEITPSGTLTTLYSFCSQSGCTDGFWSHGGLIQAADGNFYGTDYRGGANGDYGTVFKITPSGTLTTLHSFCSQSGCTDGSSPEAGLIQATDGNFYGTTVSGGANSYGTTFKITPSGTLTTLYSFCSQSGCTDGESPTARLVQSTDGNFYGTTSFGGTQEPCGSGGSESTCGTVFKLTPSGTLTTLYAFCSQSGCTDGYDPYAALVQATDGNFYGSTVYGGANSYGTVFKITPSGTLTTLYSFCSQSGCTDGENPRAGLVQGTNGNLYGIAPAGGSSSACGAIGCGTVFSLSVALVPGPFAYVANSNSNTVSVINIPTSSVINTISVGSGPLGVGISPDQTRVYVSNSGGNDVSVINAASGTVVATIAVQSSPFSVAFTPDGTTAYVVNQGSNSVSVINTTSQTVVATVPVQSSPVGVAMALTSNGTFAYVTNSESNTVSVIAVGSNPTVVKTISVGSAPHGVAVTPNSSLAYVANSSSSNISVISVASNTVTATIPVGTTPHGVAFTPDSSFAYVTNHDSNTVSVIDTASSSVVTTVPGFNGPIRVALTADGSFAYVTNLLGGNVSVINTVSNTTTGTVTVGSAPVGVAIASAPPTELQITQPLSPTEPNVFNFGTYNQAVQYPPGTGFSGYTMTTAAVEMTQAQFQQRVAGTTFANATCIVYSNTGGNCVDFQVTCNPSPCPSESGPTIAVQTGFSTAQAIINPGYLTTPIGQNQWQNIFTELDDITVKGKTQGFSEFVAVDLGATNPQGLAQFTLLKPQFPKTFSTGSNISVEIQLTSVANGKPITDASVNISVEMVNPSEQVVLTKLNAFKQPQSGVYSYVIKAAKYAVGTYSVTIYGNAFPAYQGQFQMIQSTGTTLSSAPNPSTYGQAVTFTAEVTSKLGAPPDGETVSFMKGKTVLGTGSLSGGTATFITSTLKVGTTSVKAAYGGDSKFAGSKSKPVKQVVEKAGD